MLARYDYSGHSSWEPGAGAGSIRVVAVTPHGSVVAAVQQTNSDRMVGLVYTDGHKYHLASAPNWTSVIPVGMSKAGVIIGEVQAGASYYVVSWANAHAPYKVLVRNGHYPAVPVVDGNGDIAYSVGGSLRILRHTGGVVNLTGIDVAQLNLPAGDAAFYGSRGDSVNVRLAVAGSAKVPSLQVTNLSPSGVTGFIAAGSRGTVVSQDHDWQQHIRTAAGAYVPLPKAETDTGIAISSGATVAYTAPDGLVHFVNCG